MYLSLSRDFAADPRLVSVSGTARYMVLILGITAARRRGSEGELEPGELRPEYLAAAASLSLDYATSALRELLESGAVVREADGAGRIADSIWRGFASESYRQREKATQWRGSRSTGTPTTERTGTVPSPDPSQSVRQSVSQSVSHTGTSQSTGTGAEEGAGRDERRPADAPSASAGSRCEAGETRCRAGALYEGRSIVGCCTCPAGKARARIFRSRYEAERRAAAEREAGEGAPADPASRAIVAGVTRALTSPTLTEADRARDALAAQYPSRGGVHAIERAALREVPAGPTGDAAVGSARVEERESPRVLPSADVADPAHEPPAVDPSARGLLALREPSASCDGEASSASLGTGEIEFPAVRPPLSEAGPVREAPATSLAMGMRATLRDESASPHAHGATWLAPNGGAPGVSPTTAPIPASPASGGAEAGGGVSRFTARVPADDASTTHPPDASASPPRGTEAPRV